jgi:putative oxidoreductase
MPNLTAWSPRVLSILRIMTGLLFLQHGLSKFFGFPVPFPVPGPLPPLLMAAGTIELVAGVLITFGLFTRPAAFIASGEMAIAYFMQHAPKGFYPLANNGEGAILFCFAFLYLVFAGPGPWSVDAALAKRNTAGNSA